MTRSELEGYILDTYDTEPDYPWLDSPTYAVFRHSGNKKWFALIMDVPKHRIGIKGDEIIDIVNVKGDPILISSMLGEPGFHPAYHMNKTNWISAALDGSAEDDKIKFMLDMSFGMTE